MKKSLSAPSALLASTLTAITPNFADAKPKDPTFTTNDLLQICEAMELGEAQDKVLHELVIVRTGTEASVRDVLSTTIEIPGLEPKSVDRYVDVQCTYGSGAIANCKTEEGTETCVYSHTLPPRTLDAITVEAEDGPSCTLSEDGDYKEPNCTKKGEKFSKEKSKSVFAKIMDILAGK